MIDRIIFRITGRLQLIKPDGTPTKEYNYFQHQEEIIGEILRNIDVPNPLNFFRSEFERKIAYQLGQERKLFGMNMDHLQAAIVTTDMVNQMGPYAAYIIQFKNDGNWLDEAVSQDALDCQKEASNVQVAG